MSSLSNQAVRAGPPWEPDPGSRCTAFLARKHSEVTLAALAPILGVSRPESVPNLTKRFSHWLEDRADARRDLIAIESDLGLRGEITKRSVY